MSDQRVHAGLYDYERGTQTFLGELGHWHAVPNSHGETAGRQWVKGRVEDCQAAKEARVVRGAKNTPDSSYVRRGRR
jgi:hypothetical protein